jgi:two-component system LytT family response regulator
MKTISCIIVEDEPLATERLRNYIAGIPLLKLLKAFDNGKDALEFLKDNEVDLMFLDIHLGEMSGIHLLEKNSVQCEVIITTAYPQYAVKGFDLHVTDYLLKPFVFERFEMAIDKVKVAISGSAKKESNDFILVNSEYRTEKIYLRDLLYIEGMGDYRRVHTKDKRIMTLKTFKDFEEELPSDKVARIHKSYMVSLQKIESYSADEVQVYGVKLPVSETYRKTLKSLMESMRS